MVKQKGQNTVSVVTEIIRPYADQLGLSIWDVRFEKEGSAYFLRVFIEKKDGELTIDDCEAMSRAIDGPLDEADPIAQSYYLEVSSPGLGRDLVKKEHFDRFIGEEIAVKLIRPDEAGVRHYEGILKSFDEGNIAFTLADKTEKTVNIKDTAYVRVNDLKDLGGFTE